MKKTYILTVTAIAAALVASISLAGCTQSHPSAHSTKPAASHSATATPKPSTSASATPSAPATTAPAPSTSTNKYAKQANLSPEQYQQVTAAAQSAGIGGMKGAAEQQQQATGVEVALVAEYTCPGTGKIGWGVSGGPDFVGTTNSACGEGDSASQSAAVALAESRASRAGLSKSQWTLVFVDYRGQSAG